MENWNNTPLASLVYTDVLTDDSMLVMIKMFRQIERTARDIATELPDDELTDSFIFDRKMLRDRTGTINVEVEKCRPLLGITVVDVKDRGDGHRVKLWTKVFSEYSVPVKRSYACQASFKINPLFMGILLDERSWQQDIINTELARRRRISRPLKL